MEQILYFIVFIIYIVYSIYQSVQKESEDKKIVEDWEGQPEADEKSIEELLEEYLNPQKAAENKAKAEAMKEQEDASKVLPVGENASEKSIEGKKSLAQELREAPQAAANSYREKERKKLTIDGDDTQKDRERELSPTEELKERLEKERKEREAKGKELSAAEEYELSRIERAKERDSFLSSVKEREKVNIKDQKQLDDVNKIYGDKRQKKGLLKKSFKFNAKDAIIYQIIMNRKH